MSTRRLVVLIALLILLSVGIAGFIVLRVQFNADYANANAALEQRELYIEATVRAATSKP